MVQNVSDRAADTVLLAGQAVGRATVQGLKSASAKSGVSFQYLLAKAAQESSLDPKAQAETSSAAGLFQFTRGTWLDMLKRFGGQYGFADLARQILETPSGKLAVTDEAAEKRILALRNDPEASALMAAEYARDNASALESSLGRAPDAAELYLAHFLGASGAGALLTAPPGQTAAAVLPAAAKANPAVFTAADGHARSVGDVIALVRSRFAGQFDRYADAAAAVSDAGPAPRPAPASGGFGKLDLRGALGDIVKSPAQMMMLDQLLRIIAADPMVSAEEEPSEDGFRPLGSGTLKGSDWAEAMTRHIVAAPRTPEARRAYTGPAPGPQTLDDNV
jgi:hypothetical protein